MHAKFGESPLYSNPTFLEILFSECICWDKNISDELVTKIFTASSLCGEIWGDSFLVKIFFFFFIFKSYTMNLCDQGEKMCSEKKGPQGEGTLSKSQ